MKDLFNKLKHEPVLLLAAVSAAAFIFLPAEAAGGITAALALVARQLSIPKAKVDEAIATGAKLAVTERAIAANPPQTVTEIAQDAGKVAGDVKYALRG